MTNIILDRERKAASISCKTRKETRVNETGYLLSQFHPNIGSLSKINKASESNKIERNMKKLTVTISK